MAVVELFIFILKIKINLSSHLGNKYNQVKIKNFKKIDILFNWIKSAELVEPKSYNITEDPVRPELDVIFKNKLWKKNFGFTH